MTEKEITEEFLRLFSKDWDDPAAHQGFRELREKVSGQGRWPELIDARLVALEKKPTESIALLKEVLAREPRNACAALLLASILCYDSEQPEEAIRIYESLLAQGFQDQALPDWFHMLTLFGMAHALRRLNRYADMITVANEVVQCFSESSEPQFLKRVAKALFNKGAILGQMGMLEEAIGVYEEVVERFGASSDLLLQHQVAKALMQQGGCLEQLGKPEEAIGVCDEVVERFGDSTDFPLREQVAKALLYKAESLLDTDRGDEARALFTKVEKDYLGSEELSSKVASYYDYLRSRFASRAEPKEREQDKAAPSSGPKQPTPRLARYLDDMLTRVDREKQKKFFAKMDEATKRTDGFIRDDSRFLSDFSFLLVLREWNSYTPVIPAEEESDRGGGYFIRHAREGIVIDPGYDFIENFYRAGGRLCDIDHVIVTHAHDDHTAELEALLMLLHRRWRTKDVQKKPVSLYLSAGVQRKFAGLLDLRDGKYKRVVTLCPADKGFEQRVPLNTGTKLTVLPAYHDDVITHNTAVGLAFDFATNDGDRRVVFTSDSGLFPLKLDTCGKKSYYDEDKENPVLDNREEMALYNRYPRKFVKPDLLVAHIGSIKRTEFRDKKELQSPGDEGRWYYDNHLGLLGTLTMLHQLNPEAAVISEFGSELKEFRFDLVDTLRMALHAHQNRDSPDGRQTFVIPGDLTIAYDITNRRFLCHDNCQFLDPAKLCFRPAPDHSREWKKDTQRFGTQSKTGTARTYLFLQNRPSSEYDSPDERTQDHRSAEDSCRKFFNHELPYHKK
jgi:tetratricopeptide (TPR) repeat protein